VIPFRSLSSFVVSPPTSLLFLVTPPPPIAHRLSLITYRPFLTAIPHRHSPFAIRRHRRSASGCTSRSFALSLFRSFALSLSAVNPRSLPCRIASPRSPRLDSTFYAQLRLPLWPPSAFSSNSMGLILVIALACTYRNTPGSGAVCSILRLFRCFWSR
jgi:hypothetical protein